MSPGFSLAAAFCEVRPAQGSQRRARTELSGWYLPKADTQRASFCRFRLNPIQHKSRMIEIKPSRSYGNNLWQEKKSKPSVQVS